LEGSVNKLGGDHASVPVVTTIVEHVDESRFIPVTRATDR
jgi:hypothetical protein